MSLRDELPNTSKQINFNNLKLSESRSISSDIDRFIASGGKIQEIPQGVSGEFEAKISADDYPCKSQRRGSKNGGATVAANARVKNRLFNQPSEKLLNSTGYTDLFIKKNRAKFPAGSGMQNIQIKGDKYIVKINCHHLGTFSCKKEALSVRDNFRAKMGMRPADY